MERIKTWYLFDRIPLMTITETIDHNLTVPIEWTQEEDNDE